MQQMSFYGAKAAKMPYARGQLKAFSVGLNHCRNLPLLQFLRKRKPPVRLQIKL